MKTLLTIALLFMAGCSNPSTAPPDGTQPSLGPMLNQANMTLDLQVGPPADDIVPGIVFGYDDCGFLVPRSSNEEFQIHQGLVVLTWDDADGIHMNMSLRAQRGEATNQTPSGPSPLQMELEQIHVDWNAPMSITVSADLPPGELQRPATMQIDLWYEGDPPDIGTGNC